MTISKAFRLCPTFLVGRFRTTACLLLVSIGFGVTAGCAKSKPKTESATRASAPGEAAEEPRDPVSAGLQAIAEDCAINEQHAVVSKCKGNEKQKLVRQLNSGKISRAEALPVLVRAVADEDKKLSIAASKTLEGAFRNSFGDVKRENIDKADAKKLLSLVTTLPKRQASQVAPAAVHAAVLSGQTEELYKVLDAHPNKDLRASAYVYLMRYASLTELPKVKSLVAGEDPRVAASALESLRRMPGQTDEQKKEICDFVSPLVADSRSPVAAKAVSISTTCGGSYVDAALSEADKRLATGKLNAAFVRGFDQLCLDRRGKTFGTEAQCARERRWLETVLAKKELANDARQFALLGLGLQFPDEKTAKLAEAHSKSDNKRLKSAAQRVSRSVASKMKRAQTKQSSASKPGSKKE